MPTLPTSNTVTMTVNLDKTASLSKQSIGNQGEDVQITVVVPVGISGSGYDAYIDFIQPDGLAYFKGPYDCSSGTFSFFIGVLDSLLDKDGDLSWQFILAETAGSVRTVKWSANRYKTPVGSSVGATSSAILPYVPQMVFPTTYPAANVSVADPAGNWLGNTVEDVLAEVLLKCWPVGSIYVGVGDTSPATLFGGTWSVFGAGKVLVGIDSGDASFDVVEETGGAKTHTHGLSTAAAEIVLGTNEILFKSSDAAFWESNNKAAITSTMSTPAFGYTTGVNINGSSDAGSTLAPYITVRMWKRTA